MPTSDKEGQVVLDSRGRPGRARGRVGQASGAEIGVTPDGSRSPTETADALLESIFPSLGRFAAAARGRTLDPDDVADQALDEKAPSTPSIRDTHQVRSRQGRSTPRPRRR